MVYYGKMYIGTAYIVYSLDNDVHDNVYSVIEKSVEIDMLSTNASNTRRKLINLPTLCNYTV